MITKKAYKLFRIDAEGNLHPLYVFASEVIPIGEWLEAKEGTLLADGKHVSSRLGSLAYRPGWHLADIPLAKHIGVKLPNGELAMRKNHVWCEVEYEDDVDYQIAANSNGYYKGYKFNPRDAYLKYIPFHGSYRYKTSPKMLGEWIICGNMRVLRTLTYEEVAEICRAHGYEPQQVAA